MKEVLKHPSRAEMLKAIKENTVPFADHLRQCESCRSMFALFSAFQAAELLPIERPGRQAIKRHAAVPLLDYRRAKPRRHAGFIEFDSWVQHPAVQLREVVPGFTRYITLKAGEFRLEIVAERNQYCWEFTARVYQDEEVCFKWVLQAGGRRLFPRSLGFYHWSSTRTPHIIRLMTRSHYIDFEKLSWR